MPRKSSLEQESTVVSFLGGRGRNALPRSVACVAFPYSPPGLGKHQSLVHSSGPVFLELNSRGRGRMCSSTAELWMPDFYLQRLNPQILIAITCRVVRGVGSMTQIDWGLMKHTNLIFSKKKNHAPARALRRLEFTPFAYEMTFKKARQQFPQTPKLNNHSMWT